MAPLSSFDKALRGTPEEMKKSMDEWTSWMKKNEGVIVDGGTPLGKTKRVSSEGITDIRNMVGGYTIVRAESLSAAAKIFENNPHFQLPNGSVEVMEFVQMPGM